MDTPLHLFVYGSLRQGFQNPFFDYIKNHFTYVADGKVKGCLYDLGDYPAAVPGPECRIVGELYQSKSRDDFNWAISQIDDYEGLHPEEGETALYRRETTTVYHPGGETTAWIYWYNGDTAGKPVVDSGDVLEFVKRKNGSL
ncbi:MAG TPA: gamma-glutamylcyclotransferase [Lacibacter sp.]|nr:gamma-glutamylcyclotransferase [Lacibacter sp.]HMO88092.1 gamma-glutamylcyclotransferase [Lacibacter sp.]HMP86813.1 gamma-glutamylcyclotransferase [Lacibacter sp.]